MLVLAVDHPAGCLWLEVRAGDQRYALLLVVLGHPLGSSCAARGLQGREGWQLGSLTGRVSQQQIHMLEVSTGASWDGCHARGGVC